MPWWKSNSSSPSPRSSPSSPARPRTLLWGRRGDPSPRLTRQRKLRHLSDIEVGGLILDAVFTASSTPQSPSHTILDRAPSRSSSSPGLLPQPLPLPGAGAGVSPPRFGGGVPLPSPGCEEGGASPPELSPRQERVTSLSAPWSRFPIQNARINRDLVDTQSDRSTFRHYKNLLQDPNSVDTAKFRLNIPTKSAPTSGFSSPSRSPQRSSPRRLSNVDFTYNASQGHQIWSAPDVSSADVIKFSPRTSPEKIVGSPDRSPRYSPSMRSPVTRSRNPSAPPSPLHPKMFPEGSVARHDSNGNINVHPLPLPPGPSAPPQSGFSHQEPTKSETSPVTNQWIKGKLIGSGTFGTVYVATNKHTGALCAMKEVNIIPDDPKSAECLQQLEQEIKLLSQLKHPNIVQYYGSELIEDRLYIYLEYVYPGSITKYVREHCGAMTESVVRNFTRHILEGLAYLHSTNTMHRDVKGANLLVDAHGTVKLADFGMAKHLSGATAALSLKGTPHWMAPEVLQATMNKDTGYDLAVDIWSLGCTIIEMFTGKHPWDGLEGAAAMFKVLHKDPHIPETLSSEGKDFLQRCFRRNPAERPTASKLLEHPFIRNSRHHSLHGSIQAFAGIKLVDNRYSPRGRKVKSESTVKGKQLSSGEANNTNPETSESASSHFPLRSSPEVANFSHANQVVPSPSSSSFPNGVHPANGVKLKGPDVFFFSCKSTNAESLPSPSSSSYPNGMHPANGVHSKGPKVFPNFSHANHGVPSPSSSSFPNGVHLANGVHSNVPSPSSSSFLNGANHSISGNYHLYALPKPRG